VAIGEMIDVGLAVVRGGLGIDRKPEPLETWIADIVGVARRHRIAAEAEEALRAALEAVGGLLAQLHDLGQIVAVAGTFEQRLLPRRVAARERIARVAVKRDELGFARVRNREARDEFLDRLGVGPPPRRLVGLERSGVAGHQHVATEGFTGEEYSAR